jgi:arylsulfatase A-like enzyme
MPRSMGGAAKGRRVKLGTVVACISLAWLVACGGEESSEVPPAPDLPEIVAPESAPNIVIILADDLGWRDVGYNGSEIETPRIDAVAAGGVQLERFYAHPICSPTRAALMTGRSPTRLGVVRPIEKNNTEGLPLSERVLPEFLAAAGYQTVMAGKWHLGHNRAELLPLARGFESFYGHVTGGIGYWDKVHGGGYDWQRDGVTIRDGGYTTRLIATEAVRLIEKRDRERRLFLYASFNAPHTPNEAPKETLDRYAQLENPHRQRHAAMVSELDAGVGRIVDALEREGLRENTLLFFLSDNGGLTPAAFSPGMRRWSERLESWLGKPLPIPILEMMRKNSLEGGSDNRPFRKGKATVFEGAVRVPGLVSWPGTLAPRRLDSVVTVEDILPTLADLLGFSAAPGAPFDGASQLASLEDRGDSPRPNFLIQGRSGGEAWYEFPWKLVLPAEGPPELYRLDDDPTEKTDLAASEPDRVRRLVAAHAAHPRGRSIHLSFLEFIVDPDTFGGDEDREPWADVVDGTREAERK